MGRTQRVGRTGAGGSTPAGGRRLGAPGFVRRGMALAMAAAGWAGPVAGQECENPRPGLGIGTYHCQGGSCLVAGSSSTMRSRPPFEVRSLREEHRWPYAFSVEPRLWRIEAGGPSMGRLAEGDVLVAVEGDPITTARGAMHLTAMEPGETLLLTVRRDRRLVDVSVEVEATCAPASSSAGPGERPWTMREAPAPLLPPEVPADAGLVRLERVGLVLAGPKQIAVGDDGVLRWWFVTVPVVAEVAEGSAAARAGIVAGEELALVGGAWVTEPEGAAALAALRPGDGVPVVVRHDDRARGVRLPAR